MFDDIVALLQMVRQLRRREETAAVAVAAAHVAQVRQGLGRSDVSFDAPAVAVPQGRAVPRRRFSGSEVQRLQRSRVSGRRLGPVSMAAEPTASCPEAMAAAALRGLYAIRPRAADVTQLARGCGFSSKIGVVARAKLIEGV